MGNNHDKYFGKEKRKILILGLPDSGKTSMLQIIAQGKQANLKVQKTKDLNIRDANLQGLSVTFFDLAGGERQRIFWKQHYDGTQGIIFIIDSHVSQQNIQISFTQINKLTSNQAISTIPIAICLNKIDLVQQQHVKNLQKRMAQFLKSSKMKFKIFTTTINSPNKIKQMISWLLKQTKPL